MRLPHVEIVVAPAALARSAGGAVTGPLWLRDGDAEAQADFPEVGWSDFPVAALAAWIPEAQRLARAVPAAGAAVECRFLEGPYRFALRAEGPGVWRVACVEDRAGGAPTPGPAWRTEPATFVASLARAARAVLAHCDARGWWDRDTEALRRSLEGRAL